MLVLFGAALAGASQGGVAEVVHRAKDAIAGTDDGDLHTADAPEAAVESVGGDGTSGGPSRVHGRAGRGLGVGRDGGNKGGVGPGGTGGNDQSGNHGVESAPGPGELNGKRESVGQDGGNKGGNDRDRRP